MEGTGRKKGSKGVLFEFQMATLFLAVMCSVHIINGFLRRHYYIYDSGWSCLVGGPICGTF